jgi:hypothetical protein
MARGSVEFMRGAEKTLIVYDGKKSSRFITASTMQREPLPGHYQIRRTERSEYKGSIPLPALNYGRSMKSNKIDDFYVE